MLSTVSTQLQSTVARFCKTQNPLFGHGGFLGAPSDVVTLSAAPKKTIQEELERLKQDNKPGWFNSKRFQLDEKTLKDRATFNINQEPNTLNTYLPYREKLVQSANSEALKDYDQLVQKILNKAEFYEVDSPDKLKGQLQQTYLGYKLPENRVARFALKALAFPIKMIAYPIQILRFYFSPNGIAKQMNKTCKSMPALGKELDSNKLTELFKAHATPLQEPSTRYMTAAGIAQLLHRNPEYADQLLDQATQNRPLRFMISKKKPWITGGQALVGLNVIHLNRPAMWKAIQQKKHISQHEFVHMLSESGGMTKLGFMNEIQKKEFKAARKELKKQFRTQDKSWLGGFRFILPFKSCQANSTGIRSYGFINNLEFLTVSLDTFMQEPVKLCSTKPGQKIYDVYKAVFKLDPLNDLGSAAKAAK